MVVKETGQSQVREGKLLLLFKPSSVFLRSVQTFLEARCPSVVDHLFGDGGVQTAIRKHIRLEGCLALQRLLALSRTIYFIIFAFQTYKPMYLITDGFSFGMFY